MQLDRTKYLLRSNHGLEHSQFSLKRRFLCSSFWHNTVADFWERFGLTSPLERWPMQFRIPVVLYAQCPLLKENCFFYFKSEFPKEILEGSGERWNQITLYMHFLCTMCFPVFLFYFLNVNIREYLKRQDTQKGKKFLWLGFWRVQLSWEIFLGPNRPNPVSLWKLWVNSFKLFWPHLFEFHCFSVIQDCEG